MALIAAIAPAQDKYFGKNKVQYDSFDWQYLQSRHFDIYFADQMYETAKFAAAALETSYVEVSQELDYKLQKRIPVFIYNSPNEFQQTNIIQSLLPEGVGGFTEAFKNRIAIPFNGSVEDFRHVLHHELTHAVTYDMIFGNFFKSILSRQRFFQMPLWLAEGYAEYSSRFGWDYYADMVVRDATINNYLTPLPYLGGYLAYKQGQAVITHIADKYGENKLGDIFKKGKVHLTINKALKTSIGITEEELWEEFSLEMKRRYWPELARRKNVDEISKALTNHREDPSNFNGNPIFSPKGDRLAIFSDRSDYIEIYLISIIDGVIIDRLVQGQRTGDLESLHSYLTGITFSPGGDTIAFVAKSEGNDAIYFLEIESKDIYKRKHFNYGSILAPVWSPDGKKLAFSALNRGQRDLYIYDLEIDSAYKIIDDFHDDTEPSWYPDSKRLVFSSDRPHPDNTFIVNNPEYEPKDSIDYRKIYNQFGYGNYSLFAIDVESGEIEPIKCGPGQNRHPEVSPDGDKILFVSNRNGIDNLYITLTDSTSTFAITDVLTGIGAPSWSPDGEIIAYSAFNKGGFDVFILKDWEPASNGGVLEPTDYLKGKYDLKPSIDNEAVAVADTSKDKDKEESKSALADHKAKNTDKKEDTTEVTSAPPEDTTETEEAKQDTTRIEDGEYVFVSDRKDEDDDPLKGVFTDVNQHEYHQKMQDSIQAHLFDSVAAKNKFASGEYKVYDYKVKFTPDFVSGGFSYDTFFGLRGQSIFVFSDYLGNHQIFLATDLVNTIDQTNFQLYYLYNKLRYNIGVGIFHTKNYYEDNFDFLFSDRFYGVQSFVSFPFSKFRRIDFTLSQYFIDRKYQDVGDPREDRSSKISTGTLSYVKDNIIWGITGPLNGSRYRLDIEGAIDPFSSNEISFLSTELDYRKYWHISGLFSFAVRAAGGISWGDTPKRYFLGGTTNKIGSTTIDAEVYDVENLYFSSIITPLRGYDYFELAGDRYAVLNLEFRYPFVDYLKMNFPLPLTIGYVTGNMFLDMGAAWDHGSGFKGGTSEGSNRLLGIKSSFGFGVRANLGIFVLRYDLAWRTDFNTVADKPKPYFSIGADF